VCACVCVCVRSSPCPRSLTQQREGVPRGAQLLDVVHAHDDGAATLPGVQELVGAACQETAERREEEEV